jgi:hypothetical protein
VVYELPVTGEVQGAAEGGEAARGGVGAVGVGDPVAVVGEGRAGVDVGLLAQMAVEPGEDAIILTGVPWALSVRYVAVASLRLNRVSACPWTSRVGVSTRWR